LDQASDTSTTTPKNTYNSVDATIANANPVIADTEGVFPDIFIIGKYKVILKNQDDVQIWEADPVEEVVKESQLAAIQAESANYNYIADMTAEALPVAGKIVYLIDYAAGNGAGNMIFKTVAGVHGTPDGGQFINHQTLSFYYEQIFTEDVFSVKKFGAVGDGIVNDHVAVNAAISAVPTKGVVYFPPGTYLCAISIANKQYTFKGDGKQVSILKNNSISDTLLNVEDCDQLKVSDLGFDNNNVPNDCIFINSSTYVDLQQLWITKHGNPSRSNSWGIYFSNNTLGSCQNISYTDNDELYGGHIRVVNSFYSIFLNINGGRAGTHSSVWAMETAASQACQWFGLYFEEGGGAGAMFLNACDGGGIWGYSSELFGARDPVGNQYWILMDNCTQFSMRNGRYHKIVASATGNEAPFFKMENSTGIVLEGFQIKRLCNSADPMIEFGNATSNVKITDFTIENAESLAAPSTAVDYTFLKTTSTGLSRGLDVSQIHDLAGVGTVDLRQVQRANITNITGDVRLVSVSGGIVLQNIGGTIFGAGEVYENSGISSLLLRLESVGGVADYGQTLAGNTQVFIPLAIPLDCELIGVVMIVNVAITGPASWSANFYGGNTSAIAAGVGVALNSKANSILDGSLTSRLTTADTGVQIVSDGVAFTAGDIKFIVHYTQQLNMADV